MCETRRDQTPIARAKLLSRQRPSSLTQDNHSASFPFLVRASRARCDPQISRRGRAPRSSGGGCGPGSGLCSALQLKHHKELLEASFCHPKGYASAASSGARELSGALASRAHCTLHTAHCISRHHDVERSSKLSLRHRKRLEKLLVIKYSRLSAHDMLEDDAESKPQRPPS